MINKFLNLICPIDRLPLQQLNSTLKCSNSHCFDIAGKGYVNLLPVHFKKSKNPGDSKEMVKARTHFLNTGIYEPIAKMLYTEVAEFKKQNSFCIDAGCGEGYYLDYIYKKLNEDITFTGLDISKEAILAASKRNKNITWIVASNKQIPIKRNSVDILICQFGFPFYDEFVKILKSEGKIILIDTNENHLIELRKIIYDEVKFSGLPSLIRAEEVGLKLSKEKRLTYKSYLNSNEKIMNLLSMTPHLFRTTSKGKKRIENLKETEITVDVSIRVLV